MSWAKQDPQAQQTMWDENVTNAGTKWDKDVSLTQPFTIWDLSLNETDIWTKQNVEY